MPALLVASVMPLYAQVMLFDPDEPDALAEPETGDEAVVATASGLTVATRSDFVPAVGGAVPVTLEVWLGPDVPGAPLQEVWRGHFTVGAGGLHAGSVVGNDLHAVAVPPGRHRVRVLTAPADAPERVVIAFGE